MTGDVDGGTSTPTVRRMDTSFGIGTHRFVAVPGAPGTLLVEHRVIGGTHLVGRARDVDGARREAERHVRTIEETGDCSGRIAVRLRAGGVVHLGFLESTSTYCGVRLLAPGRDHRVPATLDGRRDVVTCRSCLRHYW